MADSHAGRRAAGRTGRIFISYRRETGADLARLVHDKLCQRGYRVFMDIENLRSGPFNTALLSEIESASDVVVILTPGSLDRCRNEGDWVRQEISHAILQRKNIVPILARGFSWPPPSSPLPDDLAALPMFQGVAPSHDFFDASIDKLTTLLSGRPRHKLAGLVALVATVVVVIAGVVALWRPPPAQPPSQPPTQQLVQPEAPPRVQQPAVQPQPPAGNIARVGTTVQYLADTLAGNVDQPGLPVTIGSFLYDDSDLSSSFSSVLRETLGRALANTGKFKLVASDQAGDLPPELLDPSGRERLDEPSFAALRSPASPIRGIVRGRFFYKPPDIAIDAELALLADGSIRKARAVLPIRSFETVPTAGGASAPTCQVSAAHMEALVNPPSLAQSQANIADIQRRVPRIAHDFRLQLVVREARRDFAEGETVSYRVWSDTACHIAVFCHQVDGTTVLLFPNTLSRDTWLPADTRMDIPGEDRGGFQIVISPPLGADVVQVIACTEASSLHRMVRDLVAQPAASAPAGPPAGAYRSLDRGMVVKGISDSLAKPPHGTHAAAQWAEAHVVVNTYPKAE